MNNVHVFYFKGLLLHSTFFAMFAILSISFLSTRERSKAFNRYRHVTEFGSIRFFAHMIKYSQSHLTHF